MPPLMADSPALVDPPAIDSPFVRLSPTFAEDQPQNWLVLQGGREPSVRLDETHVPPSSYFLMEIADWDQQYELSRPIEVPLSRLRDGFLFCSEEFNASGYGKDKESALADFYSFFIEDYRNLRDTPEQEMSPGAQRLLEQYESILGRGTIPS